MTGTYPTPATIPCIDSPTRTLDHAGVRCPDLCAGRPLPPAGRERAGGEFDQPNPCRLRHRSKQEFRHAAGSDRTAYSCLSSWGDARPGERLVVPRPVVPSAQFVERRGVTATWSMRLLQPWQRHSEAGAAARTRAVVARQDAHASLRRDRARAPSSLDRQPEQARARSCVSTDRTDDRRDPDHRAVASPRSRSRERAGAGDCACRRRRSRPTRASAIRRRSASRRC